MHAFDRGNEVTYVSQKIQMSSDCVVLSFPTLMTFSHHPLFKTFTGQMQM